MPAISTEVLQVLDRAEVDGPALRLIGQLDRKLYEATNKVLEAAGGKWNRKAKAHLFDGDAADAIEPLILTGEYSRTKQDFGFFETPDAIADRVIAKARIEKEHVVLEPSAGRGALAKRVHALGAKVHCFEIQPKHADFLKDQGYAARVATYDFLTAIALTPPAALIDGFDRVVMNPPFARQDDIRHVQHAATFLKPGGRLVAIMSAGMRFRENKLTRDFRAWLDDHGGTIEDLPSGSFKSSGTMVNTCIVTMEARS